MILPSYHSHGITVYNCSCLELLPQLVVRASLVLTDPPFGIGYQNHHTQARRDVITGDEQFFSYADWAAESYRVLEEDSAVFAYTGWSEYGHHRDELKTVGFRAREPLIVQKRPAGGSLYSSFQPNSDWLLFATKGKFRFQRTQLLRNKRAGTRPNKGSPPVAEFKTRFPSCWFGPEFPYSTANPQTPEARAHPTAKTVELMSWLILLTTKPGDIVIDPFAGSGPVLVAALRKGRRAIGIEIAPTHCDTIIKRLKNEVRYASSS